MKEAVEICKLRLFLKLVAQVNRVEQLEPLPDVDFNIRAGNTLVGFATLDQVRDTLKDRLGFKSGDVERILADAAQADTEFDTFRRLQEEFGSQAVDISEAKEGLRRRLEGLRDRLDRFLADEYEVDPKNADRFRTWQVSHQPFHWLVEFYGILGAGSGFDVIIGNPPWCEYAKVKKEYTVLGYLTEKCGNLHVFCTERSLRLRSPSGRMSFIVQLPLTCSARMESARKFLRDRSRSLRVLSFDDRPGKLFDGLQHCRSVIFLSEGRGNGTTGTLATTRYQRWPTEAREYHFANLEYAHVATEPIFSDLFPKFASDVQEAAFAKLKSRSNTTLGRAAVRSETEYFIFYQEATQYWVKATAGLPYYAKNGVEGAPAHGRYLYFAKAKTASAACAVLNSSLFYAYFIAHSDCFHLSDTLVRGFPILDGILDDPALVALNMRLMRDLRNNAELKTIHTKDGDDISYAEFYCLRSKPVLDAIDAVLAQHYGFTAEELDFIVNYDVKYRVGQDDTTEGDGE